MHSNLWPLVIIGKTFWSRPIRDGQVVIYWTWRKRGLTNYYPHGLPIVQSKYPDGFRNLPRPTNPDYAQPRPCEPQSLDNLPWWSHTPNQELANPKESCPHMSRCKWECNQPQPDTGHRKNSHQNGPIRFALSLTPATSLTSNLQSRQQYNWRMHGFPGICHINDRSHHLTFWHTGSVNGRPQSSHSQFW